MSNSKTVMSQAANSWAGPTYIEDVFSTYLTGAPGAGTHSINNGIDLAGEGGMVWGKARTAAAASHEIVDTERGISGGALQSNTINSAGAANTDFSSFTSTGFTISSTGGSGNLTYYDAATWTFRKAPRFFDVVTYTGTGSARTVNHNLGSAPGCILIKCTTLGSTNWLVYHAGQGAGKFGYLNTTGAFLSNTSIWQNTAPTDTQFYLGTGDALNGSGQTYVAYLFAHDPLGPSGDGSDGLIACGSYTGNGSTNGPEIDLGWEPQWLLVKRASGSGNWQLWDSMRGWCVGADSEILEANTTDPENNQDILWPQSSGFKINYSLVQVNGSGEPYIYIAIRRGPMRAPESGTEVFAAQYGNNSGSAGGNTEFDAGFPVDFATVLYTTGGSSYPRTASRLTGNQWLRPYSTSSYLTDGYVRFDSNTSWLRNQYSSSYISHMFRRAPGFFDAVTYTGDGVAGRTVSHNLGVAPEMMIVKTRNASGSWWVYHTGVGVGAAPRINADTAPTVSTTFWNSTAPAEDVFTLGNQVDVNGSSDTCIAYLFATLPGVSKVGSYTGNGTSQTIDCGFTTGARFILIKRTDSTGDWYIWDTARGIVAGNDPHLSLNTTAAQVTTNDSIDPDSTGFIVNQVSATNVNVSSASYIFLAIA